MTPDQMTNSRAFGADEGGASRPPDDVRRARQHRQHAQMLASLGEMAAGVAHQVNNPLGSILLHSELLLRQDAPPEARRGLKVIHDEAKRAARVLTDLLTYRRPQASDVSTVDLRDTVQQAVALRSSARSRNDITVRTGLGDRPLWVNGCHVQLVELFANLLRYAEDVLRGRDGALIHISAAIDDGWTRLSIADNGPGIRPEDRPRIFYPFAAVASPGGGSGLELSTCYGIVTDHKGLICAEGNVMGGSSFTVELPLAGVRRPGRRRPRS